MKKYIYIGAFGFMGAIARFALKQIDFSLYFQHLPVTTFLINIIGSFLFSFIITLAYETGKINHNLRLGMTVGFFGAFTTFSTFCKDAVALVSSRRLPEMLIYVVLSIGCGLLVSYGGAMLVKNYVLNMIGKLKAQFLPLDENITDMTGDTDN